MSTLALGLPSGSMQPFVMYPHDSGTGIHDQVLALCRRAGFAPRVAQEARSAATLVGLVAAGLGVSLVPASFRGIGGGGVVYRPIRDPGAKSAMWVVVRTGVVTVQDRHFLDAARMSDAPRRAPLHRERRPRGSV